MHGARPGDNLEYPNQKDGMTKMASRVIEELLALFWPHVDDRHKGSKRDKRIWLWLSFGGAALVCAIDLGLLWWHLQFEPRDGMYGAPLWIIYVHPTVLMFTVPIVTLSGGLAFLLIYYWLRDTVRWMKRISAWHLLCAAVCLLSASTGSAGKAAAQEHSSELHVEIEPAAPVFETGDDAVLRVTIWNRRLEGCGSVFIDPILAPNTSPGRPFSELRLQIRDDSSRPAERNPFPTINYGSLRATSLIPIHCGYFYGAEIYLSRADWYYKLNKGRYTVRAELSIQVRSFVGERPDLLDEFLRLTRLPEDLALQLLGEGTYESAEISFEILKDPDQ